MGEVDPGGVEQLMAMGFDEDKATKALQRANNDFEEAVTIILDDDCTVLPTATPPRSRRVSVISDGSSDEDDEHNTSWEAGGGHASTPDHSDGFTGMTLHPDKVEETESESNFVALPQPVTLEVRDGPLGLGLRSCSVKELVHVYSAELGYFTTVNGMQGAAEAHNERANSAGAQRLVEGMLLTRINDEAIRGLDYDTVQQLFSEVARPLSVTFAPRSLVEHEERNFRRQREAEQQLIENRRRVLRQLRTQLRSRRLFLEAADLVTALEVMLQLLGTQSSAFANAQDEDFGNLLCAKDCVPPLVSMLAKGELLAGHARSWQDQVDIWDRIGHADIQVRAWRQLISRIVEVCVVLLRDFTATWVLEPLHQMLNGQGSFFSYTPASYVVNGRKIRPPNEGAQELHYHAVNVFKSMGGLDLIARSLHISPRDAQHSRSSMDTRAPADRSSSEAAADTEPEARIQLSLSDTKWALHILYRIHNLNNALEWRRVAGAVEAIADRIETLDPDMLDANREPLPATLTHMLQLKNALLALSEEGDLEAGSMGADQSESESGEEDMGRGDLKSTAAVDDKRPLSHRAAARLASSLSLRLSAVWSRAALRCFFSPKLNPRRLGAEIFGQIARHIKQGRMEFCALETDGDDSEDNAAAKAPTSNVLSVRQSTSGTLFLRWLQRCGIWRRLLADEMLDDRVVDEVEKAMLLPLLPHTQESVEKLQSLALPKLSRASVQKLLASWVLHRDFPRTMLLHFLQRLSQRLTCFISGKRDANKYDADEVSILNFVDKVMAGRTKQIFARSKAVAKAGLQLLLTCLWCPALDAELQEANDDARLRSLSATEKLLDANDESKGYLQYDSTMCDTLRKRLLHALEDALTLPAMAQHRLPLALQLMNSIRTGISQVPLESQALADEEEREEEQEQEQEEEHEQEQEQEDPPFPLRRLTFKLMELVISSFPAPVNQPIVLQTDFGKDTVPALDLQGTGLGFITPPASPARVGAQTTASAASPGKRSRWNPSPPMPSPGTPGTPRDRAGSGVRDCLLSRAEFIEGNLGFVSAHGHCTQCPPADDGAARCNDGVAAPHASKITDLGSNHGLGGSDLVLMLTEELQSFFRRGAAGHGTSVMAISRSAIGKRKLNAAAEAYLSGIRARLQLLSFVHRYSSLTLSNRQLDDLWDLFVGAPYENDASKHLRQRVLEVFFSWLRITSCFHSAHECKWLVNGQTCFGSAIVQQQQHQSQQLDALLSLESDSKDIPTRADQKHIAAANWASHSPLLRRTATPPGVDCDHCISAGTDATVAGRKLGRVPCDSQTPSSGRDDRRLALFCNAEVGSICSAHEHLLHRMESMALDNDALAEFGLQAYHLFISLFIHVNGGGDEDFAASTKASTRVQFLNMHNKPVTGSMYNVGGVAPCDNRPFGSQNRPPPQSRSGAKMVGQWVKIKQDVAGTELRDGRLASYDARVGKYIVVYADGSSHEKSLHSLHEWYMLPPAEEQMPRQPRVARVHVEPSELDGMRCLWALALRAGRVEVSDRAASLLLSLYEKMDRVSIKGRGRTFRGPSAPRRGPAPTFWGQQPDGSFADAIDGFSGNPVLNPTTSGTNVDSELAVEHEILEHSISSQPSSPPTGAAAAKAAVNAAAIVGGETSTGACSPLSLTTQGDEESKADRNDNDELRLRWAQLMPGDMLDAQTCWVDETDGTTHYQWVASEVISSQDASGRWYGSDDTSASTLPDVESLNIRRVVLRHHPCDEDTDSDDEEEVFLEDAIAGGVCTWPPARRGAAGPRLAELYEWSSLAHERKEVVAELPVLDCRAGLLNRVFEQLDHVLSRACATDDGVHGGLSPKAERTISRGIAILARFLALFRNNLRHRTHGGSSRGQWLDIHVKGMGIDETGQDIADLQLHVHSKTSARGLHSKIRDTYGSHQQVRLFFNSIALADGGSATGVSTFVNASVSAPSRRREMLPSEQTLEDLGMSDGAQIICKFATFKDAPSRSPDFSPADEIAASDRYFDILFRLLKLAPDPSLATHSRLLSPATFAQLWSLLRDIPTNFSEMQTVIGAARLPQSAVNPGSAWDAIFARSRGHWRIIYSLQVLHALLLPPDDEDVARAVEFRRLFLISGGFTYFVNFVMRLCDNDVVGTEACTTQQQRDIFTLPVCLRSLSFLLAGAMKAYDGCDSTVPIAADFVDSQTTVPRLHRQFSHSSVGIVMSDIAPVELSCKIITLLRAAHTVHAPLHSSPLQHGPQPGQNVVVEYLKRGGTRYKAVVLRLRPSDCTIDVVYGDDEVEEHVPLQRVRLGTVGPEPVGVSEVTGRFTRTTAVFGEQADAAALAQALIDGMSALHMMMQTWIDDEGIDRLELDTDSVAASKSTTTCLRQHIIPFLVHGSKASGAGIRGLLLASPDDRVRAQAARVVRKLWDKEQSDNKSVWRRMLLLQTLEHALEAMPLNCITCREICDLVAAISTSASIEALPAKANAFRNLTAAVMRKIRCALQGVPPDASGWHVSSKPQLQCPAFAAEGNTRPAIEDEFRTTISYGQTNLESITADLALSEDKWRKQNIIAAAEADGREIVSVALVKILRSLVMASDTLRLHALHVVAAPSTLSFAGELLQVFLLPIMQSSGKNESATMSTDSLSMTTLTTQSDEVRAAGFKLLVSLLRRSDLQQAVSGTSVDGQEQNEKRNIESASHECHELLGAVRHVQLFLCQTPVPLERIFDSKVKTHKFVPDWAYTPHISVPNTAVTKPRNSTGVVGLINQGATCYMNSSLQQLFAIAPFRQAILRAHAPPPIPPNTSQQDHDIEERTQAAHPPTPPGSDADEHDQKMAVLHHLQRTFCFLRHGASGCYDPLPLVPACNVLKLEDPVFSQNDASEFLTKLLECVEDAMRKEKSADAEIVSETFGGATRKAKFCHHCKRVFPSSRDPFVVLNVPVMENMKPKTSLQQGLNDMTAPEIMGGDNKVFCDVCQSKQTHTYSSFVEELPQHLTISLGRFEFNYQTMDRVKLNHRVEFPQELDMAPYTTARLQVDSTELDDEYSATASVENDAMSDNSDHSSHNTDVNVAGEAVTAGSATIYELNGVLIHEGDARFGHYYSYIRRDPEGHGCSTGSAPSARRGTCGENRNHQQWLCCNDDRVSIFNSDELEECCFGGETEVTLSDAKTHQTRTERQDKIANAFVLFYSRKVKESNKSCAAPELSGLVSGSLGTTSSEKERELMRRPSDKFRAMAAALNQRQAAAAFTKDEEERERASSVTAVSMTVQTLKPSSHVVIAVPSVVQHAIARAELFAAVQSDNAKLHRQSMLFKPATLTFILELCEEVLEPRVRSERSPGNQWMCMSCTLLNPFSATACAACGGSAPPLPACPLPLTQTATRFFLCVTARLGLQEGARFDVDDPFQIDRWACALAEHFMRSIDASRWLLRACTIELSQQSAVHGGDNATSHDDRLGCDGTFSTGNGTAQNCAWLPAMLFDCAAKGHNPAAAAALVRWLRVAAQTLMAGAATDDVTIVEQFVLGTISLFPLASRQNSALEAFIMLWAPENCTDAFRNRLRQRQRKRQHKRRRRRRRRMRVNRRMAAGAEDILEPCTPSSSSAGSKSDSDSDSDIEVESAASATVAGGGLCCAPLLRPLLVKCGVLAHLAHLYLGSSSPLAPPAVKTSDANDGLPGLGSDDVVADTESAILLPQMAPIERIMESSSGCTSVGSDGGSVLAAMRIRRAAFAPLLGAIRLLLREIVKPLFASQGEASSISPGTCFRWILGHYPDGTGSRRADSAAQSRTRLMLTSPELWKHIALRHPSQLFGGTDGQEPELGLPDEIDVDIDASVAQRSYRQFSGGSEFMAWLCWIPCADCAKLAAGAAGYSSLATKVRKIQCTVILSLLHALHNPHANVYSNLTSEPQQQMRARIDVTHEPDLSKVPLACELSSWRLRDRALRRAGAHLVLVGTAETDKDELEDAPVPIIFNVCNQALVNAKRAGFHEVRDGIDNYSTDIATHHWLETDSDSEDDAGFVSTRHLETDCRSAALSGPFALRCLHVVSLVHRTAQKVISQSDSGSDTKTSFELQCSAVLEWLRQHPSAWLWALTWLARAASPLTQQSTPSVCSTEGRRCHSLLRRMVSTLELQSTLAGRAIVAFRPLLLAGRHYEPATAGTSRELQGTNRVVAADIARDYAMVVCGAGRDTYTGGSPNGLYTYAYHYRGLPCYTRLAYRNDGTSRRFLLLCHRDDDIKIGGNKDVPPPLAAWYICTMQTIRSTASGDHTVFKPFYKSHPLPANAQSVLPPSAPWLCEQYGQQPVPTIKKLRQVFYDNGPDGGELQTCAGYLRYMKTEAMEVKCVHCSTSVPITNQQELEAEWNGSQGARSLELQCGKCQGALTVTFRDPPAAFVQTSSLVDDHDDGRSYNVDDSIDCDDVE